MAPCIVTQVKDVVVLRLEWEDKECIRKFCWEIFWKMSTWKIENEMGQ